MLGCYKYAAFEGGHGMHRLDLFNQHMSATAGAHLRSVKAIVLLLGLHVT